MLRRWGILVTLGFVVGVGLSAQAIQVGRDAAVYAALFKGDYPNLKPLSQLVVQEAAIPMQTLAGSAPEWLKAFDDVPMALRIAVGHLNPTKPRTFDRSLFPAGTRLAPEQAIRANFVGHGIEDGWALFRRQYGTDGWVAFSEVLYTAEATDALVYYEGRCGGLCGEGGYIWLHRAPDQSSWSIRKKIISWVS
jgi:hypothetical protein